MSEENAPKMPESELNELVHQVSDFLEDYTEAVDRIWVNNKLTEMADDLGICLVDDR